MQRKRHTAAINSMQEAVIEPFVSFDDLSVDVDA
jgi:hypothetical protein